MPFTLTNPPALHDPLPFGYSHSASIRGETVVIAGQYGSDATGAVVSDDFATQATRALDNLGTALLAQGLTHRDVVRLGTYVVGHDQDTLTTLVGLVHQIWGQEPPAQTLLGVASLALPGMLFEVDALAVRP